MVSIFKASLTKKSSLCATDLQLVLLPLCCDAENCPDHNPSLSSWNPGHQPQKAVVVRTGQLLKLESSATFLSLTIQSGGKHVKLHDGGSAVLDFKKNNDPVGFVFF